MATRPQPSRGAARVNTVRPQGNHRQRGNRLVAQHLEMARLALRRLLAEPVSALMTVAVMAIALTLPTVLYVGLQNATSITAEWQGGSQISVFLDRSLATEAGRDLANQLAENTQISDSLYLSKADALEEFRRYAGVGESVALLTDNPLPAVILLQPAEGYRQPGQLEQLLTQLRAVDGVADVVVDLAWVERLRAMVGFAERAVLLLAGLLALGVLLVVGNTIRLEIENRRDEILVTKLVGATDDFVRRPFLYTGFWYGIGAALLALLLINGILIYMAGALASVIGLYSASVTLQGLTLLASLVVISVSALMGVLGAWLAVFRHLAAIEPR